MKHNWVFTEAKHEDGCTELIFRCSNTGCTKFASFATGSRYISRTLKFGLEKLNKTETKWDVCHVDEAKNNP
jgi:hypothetical protein